MTYSVMIQKFNEDIVQTRGHKVVIGFPCYSGSEEENGITICGGCVEGRGVLAVVAVPALEVQWRGNARARRTMTPTWQTDDGSVRL